MRIDHQGFMNHKKIVSVVAMALIVTLALSAGCFVKSPPKQKPKVSSKSSAPAAQEPLKIEVVGTYRIGDAEYVQDQIRAILPERLTWSSWSSGDNRLEYEVPSTIDSDVLAKKIRFGKVTVIQPRLIRVTRLRTLQIGGAQVTDAGMAHLSDLTELRSLDINNTTITEQGLRHLSSAPNLRDIRAEESGVSQREIQRFKNR